MAYELPLGLRLGGDSRAHLPITPALRVSKFDVVVGLFQDKRKLRQDFKKQYFIIYNGLDIIFGSCYKRIISHIPLHNAASEKNRPILWFSFPFKLGENEVSDCVNYKQIRFT